MRKIKLPAILFSVITILSTNLHAGDSLKTGEQVTVIPGSEYAAGWLHRIFFGKHWRDLWTTPLTVPVLDLRSFSGGLKVLKLGGGYQTKSLHFKGNDGKYYKFRSINKDPEKVLPPDVRNTFVADIVQDQISTAHPLSAIIAAPLLNAVGVLNSVPVVVVLPDDPLLGAYRDEFKGLLGTFAENPKDETEEELIFAGAEKIIKEYKIFEKTAEDNDDLVDGIAYLKARLMDIYLGDWDRHVGQWKWARYRDGELKIWQPIPRDRDQAFALYDGLFPWIIAKAVPQIEGFSENYPQINDLSWSGRHLDRRFLAGVSRADWDSLTNHIQHALSDSVITSAVRHMPPSWFEKTGPELIEILKARREKLPSISREFYELNAAYVSIFASDKRDFAEIERLDDDRVQVSLYKISKKANTKAKRPYFKRLFHDDETNEIWIDLLDDDDIAVVRGQAENSILVRIVGGSGKDTLIDSSRVKGFWLGITPFRTYTTSTILYDSGDKTATLLGPSAELCSEKWPEPKSYDPSKDRYNEKYEPQIEDRDYDWKAGARFNFNSNDGLTIGGGPILYKFGFRTIPYIYRMELIGAYVTRLNAFMVNYTGEFYSVFPRKRLFLDIRKTAGNTNFYGYGNESTIDAALAEKDHYLIRADILSIVSNLRYPVLREYQFWAGIAVNNAEITGADGSILDVPDPPNIRRQTYYGLNFGFSLDTRDHEMVPAKGIFIDIKSYNYPRFINNSRHYHKLMIDLRSYLYNNWLTASSLALRINGENLWGKFPLHEAAFLGGQRNLRGFPRERFAGDALLFGSIELRSYLLPLKIIFPGRVGLSAFAETGRVFYAGEKSSVWHPSFGGGIWISFLNRLFTAHVTGAKSNEDLQIYLTTGYMF